MASVASLALPSPICGTEVAKVWPLLAHCTLHGTEGMAICFNIFWVTYNHTTFQLAGTVNVNLVQLISQRLSDSLKAVRVRLAVNSLAHLGCALTQPFSGPREGFIWRTRRARMAGLNLDPQKQHLTWQWLSSDALAGHFVSSPVNVLLSEVLPVTGVCPFPESWHIH